MIKAGTLVEVNSYHSKKNGGLSYDTMEGVLTEDCSDGWDVVDIEVENENDDTTKIVSVYSFSVTRSENERMSESEFCEIIQEALYQYDDSIQINTFEDKMVLTMNKGLCVKIGNNNFQLVVHSA